MIKAVLEYTDCMGDKRVVNYYLSQYPVTILKTRKGSSIYLKVTILVDSIEKLNEVVSLLNNKTHYGVTIVKVKKQLTYLEIIFKNILNWRIEK